LGIWSENNLIPGKNCGKNSYPERERKGKRGRKQRGCGKSRRARRKKY